MSSTKKSNPNNTPYQDGWNHVHLLPLPKIKELLSRSEIYATWRFFEEKFQFINSINFHSISGYFNHDLVHKTIRMVFLACKIHKGDYQHMKMETAKRILNNLYSNDFVSVKTLEMMMQVILDRSDVNDQAKIYKLGVKMTAANLLLRFLVSSQYVDKFNENFTDLQNHQIKKLSANLDTMIGASFGDQTMDMNESQIEPETNYGKNASDVSEIYHKILLDLSGPLITYVNVYQQDLIRAFRLIFAVMATPKLLNSTIESINNKKITLRQFFRNKLKTAELRLQSHVMDIEQKPIYKHFQKLHQILDISNPFVYFYKLADNLGNHIELQDSSLQTFEQFLDRQMIISCRQLGEKNFEKMYMNLEEDQNFDLEDPAVRKKLGKRPYLPVVLSGSAALELSDLLESGLISADLSQAVFNFLNNSLESIDYQTILKNKESADILFFRNLIKEVEFIPGRQIACKTIRSILKKDKINQIQQINDYLVQKCVRSKNLRNRVVDRKEKGSQVSGSSSWHILNDKQLYKKYLPTSIKNFKAKFNCDVTENILDFVLPYSGYSPVKSVIDIDKLPIYQSMSLNHRIQHYIFNGAHHSKFFSDEMLLNLIYEDFFDEINDQFRKVIEEDQDEESPGFHDYQESAVKFIEILIRFKWSNPWELLDSIANFWLRIEFLIRKWFTAEEIEAGELLPSKMFGPNIIKILYTLPDFMRDVYAPFFLNRINEIGEKWCETCQNEKDNNQDLTDFINEISNVNKNNTHNYKFQANDLNNENQENIEPNSVNSIDGKVPKNSTFATTAINFTEYSENIRTTDVYADESEMGTDIGYSKNVEDTDGYVADNESNMNTTVAN